MGKETGKKRMLEILKVCGALFGALMLIWFLLPVFRGIINIGNLSGIFLCGLVLWLTLYPRAGRWLWGLWSHHAGKAVLTVLSLALIAALGFGTVMSVRMVGAMHNSPAGTGTVVVLGCQVKGTKPSLMLSRRLEAAAAYLSENPQAMCVVSGGQGRGEDISEALAMKNWLVDWGIQEERIYLEDQSRNTVENIVYSQKIIEDKELPQQIILVSDGFHLYRGSLIAQKHGVTVSSCLPAETSWYLLPTYWLREIWALAQEIFLH